MKFRILMSVALLAVLGALVLVTSDSPPSQDVQPYVQSQDDAALKSLSIK